MLDTGGKGFAAEEERGRDPVQVFGGMPERAVTDIPGAMQHVAGQDLSENRLHLMPLEQIALMMRDIPGWGPAAAEAVDLEARQT